MAAVKTLSARADVAYAQPNYIFQVTAIPNDSGYPKQWHYFDNGSGPNQAPGGINLPAAWKSNQGSSAVVVALAVKSYSPPVAITLTTVHGGGVIPSGVGQRKKALPVLSVTADCTTGGSFSKRTVTRA